MTPTRFAQLTLCLYATVAVAAVLVQMLRCAGGPGVWWLYVFERLACGMVWHVRGQSAEGRPMRCPFPQDSGALIVGNHRSPADPIVLWQNHHLSGPEHRIRPISYMMAREFYENPRLNWFYRIMRSIPVSRDGRDMAPVMQAIRQLKQGDLVGIFPEGGINRGLPGVKAANPGVAFLALSTKAPVYPVYISGSPIGSSMLTSLFRTSHTRLTYGEPIDLSPWQGQKKSHEVLAEVTDTIMNAIAALGGVTYAGTQTAEDAAPQADPEKQADATATVAPPVESE